MKRLLPLAVFIWLVSPSFYWAWQGAAPVDSPAFPPLSIGQQILLAPYIMLDQMGYWLWPFASEPLSQSVSSSEVMRLGLFYWLIAVLIARLSWRLRRVEPTLWQGLAFAFCALIPFSGIISSWVQPFDSFPVCIAGAGLAYVIATTLIRGIDAWRATPPKSRFALYQSHARRLLGLIALVWLGATAIHLVSVVGCTWDERLNNLQTRGESGLFVAVETARDLAKDGQFTEAESLILRSEQAAPWYGEIPVVKAEILIARGQNAAAQDYLDEALSLNPTHARARELTSK
ncbi:MAG: tetratricopeptide repeat protein [Puniceicoccales bacterium]